MELLILPGTVRNIAQGLKFSSDESFDNMKSYCGIVLTASTKFELQTPTNRVNEPTVFPPIAAGGAYYFSELSLRQSAWH